MERATLTICLPRTMKEFIGTKMLEGRFSTPSEYIRSLTREDQDLNSKGQLAALVRRLRDHGRPLRGQGKDGQAVAGRRPGKEAHRRKPPLTMARKTGGNDH
jgi:Arc/MetJ-type ribon-helix-helix transcriptional regulator